MTGAAPEGAPPLLSMRGIVKRFDGRVVLDGAGLDLAAGEVHALLGENGAGKSTLMNVLTGVYRADAGDLRLGGQRLQMRGPRDAISAGIGMVHQHFRLVPRFTVAENLVLAAAGRAGIRNRSTAARRLEEVATGLGFAVDPDAEVAGLSVAERQRVEVCKVLALGARIVVLDEPTAVLADAEAASLLAAVRRMADDGRSVILITHRLRDVAGHSDRVTVMRGGATVAANLPARDATTAELARWMVGDAGVSPTPRRVDPSGPVRLAIRGLRVPGEGGGVGLEGIDLAVRGGEILGVAGVGGNGQQPLVDVLTGLAPATGGVVELDGCAVVTASVAQRRDLGLRVIPASRMASGLVGALGAAANLALTRVRGGDFGHFWLDRRRMREFSEATIASHAIHGAGADRPVRLLSGGNAQKLLLARELAPGAAVVVAHSPTRGLDLPACGRVHGALRRAADAGAACLLISEDIEEILALSSRILVMSRGRIAGELPGGSPASRIGALMLGHA